MNTTAAEQVQFVVSRENTRHGEPWLSQHEGVRTSG